MKQRVAIARGMAMEPDILLMDEPFAALDALTRRKMQDELLQLWDDTRFTVLFVTHSIPEAIRIGSRILLLSPHPGQVKAELNSLPRDALATGAGGTQALESKIHRCCSPTRSKSRRCRMAELGARVAPGALLRSRSTRRRSASWRSRSPHGSGSATSPRCASSRSSIAARADLGRLRALAQQPAAVPDVLGDARGVRRGNRERRPARAGR